LRVPAPGKNKRVGVCGAYNPVTGQLLSRTAAKIRARDVVVLLAKLAARARRTGRLILVVLDNAQLHKGQLARRAWERYAAWIRPVWLPGYSPDLNDIERIWKREKENYFANSLAPSFEAFEKRVRARFRSLAHVQCRAGRARRASASPSRMIKDFLRAA
jgi:transposase